MRNKIVTKLETTNEVVLVTPPSLVMLESAISSGMEPEKLLQFYAIHEKFEANEARKAYSKDMVECQKNMPSIGQNKFNDQTKSWYSTYDIIMETIRPVITGHGFSLAFSEGEAAKPDQIRVICTVMHKDGHFETYHYDLDLDNCGIKGTVNKTKVHASGSTHTYGQRYLVKMIFGLSTGMDNDGNAPIETIALDQQNMLIAELDKSGADKVKFLALFGVNDINELPVSELQKAILVIKAKK